MNEADLDPRTPIDDYPETVGRRGAALALGRSLKTLDRDLSNRTMWPPPILARDGSYQRPFRFRKATLRAYLNGELHASPYVQKPRGPKRQYHAV